MREQAVFVLAEHTLKNVIDQIRDDQMGNADAAQLHAARRARRDVA